MKSNLTNHKRKFKSAFITLSILAIAATLVTGCGKRLSGVYVGDGIPIKQLNFTSGSKVEITAVMGGTSEVSYVIEGDKLKITNAGQTMILTIAKDGCIEGGGMIGKFCKK